MLFFIIFSALLLIPIQTWTRIFSFLFLTSSMIHLICKVNVAHVWNCIVFLFLMGVGEKIPPRSMGSGTMLPALSIFFFVIMSLVCSFYRLYRLLIYAEEPHWPRISPWIHYINTFIINGYYIISSWFLLVFSYVFLIRLSKKICVSN